MPHEISEQRSKNMRAIKNKSSRMELALEEALLAVGLVGFDKNLSSIFGTPDFVWQKLKVAVFCDSEFFHGKNWEIQKYEIKSRREFWWDKIQGNVEKDSEVTLLLCAQGYEVVRFWQKEIMNNTAYCIGQIQNALSRSLRRINENQRDLFSYLQSMEIPFPANEKPSFHFIDLFAGIGGFRLAMQDLGGKCVFSSEIDPVAKKTYFTNFGEMPHGDILNIDSEDIPDHDVLCAGFPCQAFSLAGKRGGFEDTRGTLFFEVARIIKAKKPKAILLENVKGLVSHDRGKTLETILNVLRNELDYYVPEPQIINAKDHGVPQNRERIFITGFRKDIASVEILKSFKYPKPIDAKFTFADIKETTVVPSKYYVSTQYLNSMKAHKARHESKGNGFGYEIISDDDITNAILVGGMGRERNLVIDRRITDFTPTTHIKGEINREYIRRMTPREWARLQGFPDEFKIIVADVHAYKQFGNSVAVPAVKAVAKKVLEIIIRE